VLLKFSSGCSRRPAEARGLLCDPAFPAGFGGVNLLFPQTTGEAFPASIGFFRSFPSSKGEIRYLLSESIKKALLPLEKGGREGFRGKPFQMAKHFQFSKEKGR
jgi:hypothetical protein